MTIADRGHRDERFITPDSSIDKELFAKIRARGEPSEARWESFIFCLIIFDTMFQSILLVLLFLFLQYYLWYSSWPITGHYSISNVFETLLVFCFHFSKFPLSPDVNMNSLFQIQLVLTFFTHLLLQSKHIEYDSLYWTRDSTVFGVWKSRTRPNTELVHWVTRWKESGGDEARSKRFHKHFCFPFVLFCFLSINILDYGE